MDGASWLQELIDEQCPAAVRVLDFPHAVGYLSRVAQAAFGVGSREAAVWLDVWAPKLKTGEPEEVLAAIRTLPTPTPEAAAAKGDHTALSRPAASADSLRRLWGAGLPDWQWDRGECGQVGGRSTPQRQWDALESPARQPTSRPAQSAL
jgi:hypothetical protein